MSEKRAEINQEDCKNWRETTLSQVFEEYKLKDIFNEDEIGLIFKYLPDKALPLKNDILVVEQVKRGLLSWSLQIWMELKLLVIGKK